MSIDRSAYTRFGFSAGRHRQGSALLIVLAILSILVLLAVTLTFTSRIELMSSQNFARHIQNRTAQLSSLDQSLTILTGLKVEGAVGQADLLALSVQNSKSDPWLMATLQNEAGETPVSREDVPVAYASPGFMGPVRLADLSGRVNLNAADEETLARLFDYVAMTQGIGEVNGEAIARNVVRYRLGEDGVAGDPRRSNDSSRQRQAARSLAEAIDPLPEAPRLAGQQGPGCLTQNRSDSNRQAARNEGEYVADLRYPAPGDDQRFQSVHDLARIAGMTPELLRAVEPYVTVFSISIHPGLVGDEEKDQSSRANSDDRRPELVDINRASASEIYEALRELYGGLKEDNLLRQFAVNIVDARDRDIVPTTLPNSEGTGRILGFERTPYITEVYPLSRSDGRGNEGQFVEIHNPWPEPFDLSGWTLRVAGANIPLNGHLPSRGFLIVTDVYQDPPAGSLPGLGSFYDVHGVVATGMHRRIIEFPALNMPTAGAGPYQVELYYRGHLIDQFTYSMMPPISSMQSFQRPGAGFVREVAVRQKNPFALAPDRSSPETRRHPRYGPRDGEFTSVLELFEVFAGFPRTGQPQGPVWHYPQLVSPSSESPAARDLAFRPDVIDARIIDIFTVEEEERPAASELARQFAQGAEAASSRRIDPYAGDVDFRLDTEGNLVTDAQEVEVLLWQRFAQPPRGLRHGLVNVNTAPEPVLVAAGLTPRQARSLAERRAIMLQGVLAGELASATIYRNLSDVLVDEALWGPPDRGDICQRLQDFAPLAERLTVNSRAFLLEGRALERSDSTSPRITGPMLRAVVAFDKPRPELVTWHFSP